MIYILLHTAFRLCVLCINDDFAQGISSLSHSDMALPSIIVVPYLFLLVQEFLQCLSRILWERSACYADVFEEGFLWKLQRSSVLEDADKAVCFQKAFSFQAYQLMLFKFSCFICSHNEVFQWQNKFFLLLRSLLGNVQAQQFHQESVKLVFCLMCKTDTVKSKSLCSVARELSCYH